MGIRNGLTKAMNFVAKQVGINTIYTSETGRYGGFPIEGSMYGTRRRGIQVYSPSQILRMTGRNKGGIMVTWGAEQPYFYLTPEQRNAIFRLSAIVFGIVSSRMNKISAAEFNIIPAKEWEEREAEKMKELYQIFMEQKKVVNVQSILLRAKIVNKIRTEMPLLFDDLSNFNSCLLRWKRAVQRRNEFDSDQIKEWINEPCQGVTWEQWIKKVVYNLHIHGTEATYKYIPKGETQLEHFDSLPGGTVFKMKHPYFSTMTGFIQVVSGFDPQIFYENEICYMEYLSTSVQSQGMVPLEALINMISEHLLFDGRMAEVADGTLPPEKMVIVTDNGPFGALNQGDAEFKVPIDENEQKRIETKVNEPRKNAIVTFSGNNVEVIDLSRENNWEFHSGREKDIKEMCGFVFNMTAMELNMAGSEDTSGRATAEVQQDIEQGKGTGPIMKMIETHINKSILPYRYGEGWRGEFTKSKNDEEEKRLDGLKLDNGELTQNELREKYSLPTFEGPKYDLPRGAQPSDNGDSSLNPFFTKEVR